MSRLQHGDTYNTQNTVARLIDDFTQRIIACPPGICPIDLQLSFLQVCHTQSCGKCVPCRVGLGQLASLLNEVVDNKATEKTLKLIEETARNIMVSADCAIGFEAARMILTGLDGFKEEYESHINSKRCLGTFEQPIPCVELCPAHVDVPGYVALVNQGRYDDAINLIRKDNPFPTACALICEHPCERRCRRNMIDSSINIRGVKRYAVDQISADKVPTPKCAENTGKSIAVIGGGPSGMTAAYFLAQMGHKVVVFESKNKLGGMLRYGIPNYRFPRERLDQDLDAILSMGNIEIKYETTVGKDITLEQLHREYDAIYIAIGAQAGKNLGIEGLDAKGVFSAVDLLREIGDGKYPDLEGKRVAVIGGGNVAIDCARTAIRAKAESVALVYRRRKLDMTAQEEEIESAMAEGIELMTLQAPIKIEKDEEGNCTGLWVEHQMSSVYGRDGRPSTVTADEKLELIPCDIVLAAVGQDVESEYFEQAGLPIKRKLFVADECAHVNGHNFENIFAGGDCVSGPATVIKAIAAGKIAAANIDEFLGFHHEISSDVEIPLPLLNNKVKTARIHLKESPSYVRITNCDPVEIGMSEEEIKQETSRCLRCDHFGCGVLRGGRKSKW